jgi:hypothetical protein
VDSSITEAELLAELQAVFADTGPDDAYTTPEIADLLGCTIEMARKRVRTLLANGRMEACRVTRTRMDGISTTVSAYRMVGLGQE